MRKIWKTEKLREGKKRKLWKKLSDKMSLNRVVAKRQLLHTKFK